MKMLSVLIFVALLASCGGGKASNQIVFWNPLTGADHENITKMIADYNATNPEFPVKNVSIKEQDMYRRIPAVVGSGRDVPDLNLIHAERLNQYVDLKMLSSFDSLLSQTPNIKGENYVRSAWDIGNINNSRYGIPLDIHNWATYYNQDLVDKYGPTVLDDGIITFDEIKMMGDKAKADGIATTAFTWVKPSYMATLAQMGGSLTADGINPTLNTPESLAVMQLFADLFTSGYTVPEGADATQQFLSGKLIFLPEGIWMQNYIKAAPFNWGITGQPQVSSNPNKMVNWASSHNFVLFNNKARNPEKEEGIMQFIEWIRLNSLEWAKAGQNPATLALQESPEYRTFPHSIFTTDLAKRNSLTIFNYKYNGYVSDYLDAHAFDPIFGKRSPQDFVEGTQKEVADKIASN